MLKELPQSCFNSGEPYQKYKELSMSKDNQTIIDIGSYRGFSALALSENKTNQVHTFDIGNYLEIELPDNLKFHQKGGLEISKGLIKKADIILLDVDPHDGIQEPIIFDYIIKSGFKGMLIIDDVNLNDKMKSFFDSIKYEKELADWHHSGTGLVWVN